MAKIHAGSEAVMIRLSGSLIYIHLIWPPLFKVRIFWIDKPEHDRNTIYMQQQKETLDDVDLALFFRFFKFYPNGKTINVILDVYFVTFRSKFYVNHVWKNANNIWNLVLYLHWLHSYALKIHGFKTSARLNIMMALSRVLVILLTKPTMSALFRPYLFCF